MAINQQLFAARKRKHWSQKRAAEACKVDVQTFFRWEHREQEPHGYNLDQMCKAFGLPMEELGYAHLIETTASPVLQEPLQTPEQVAVVQRLEGESTMDRRDALGAIFTATGIASAAPLSLVDPEPWERLSAALEKSSGINTATFDHFNHLLSEGWELSNVNDLEAAEGVLVSFLPKILAIPSREVTARTAYLASHGLRLQSVLIHHRLHIADKVSMCQRSVEYAHSAEDTNTLVAALIELADAYEFDGQMEQCYQTLQEALFYSTQASPLVQSRAYSNNAIILASTGRKREAELYIGLARDVFPDNPLLDPGYALADSSIFTLAYHTGLVRLGTGQTPSAPEGFDLYKEYSSAGAIPERIRLEIVNGLSKAALQTGDLETYAYLFESALIGAATLGSQKRFDEAIRIFQELSQDWLRHQRIKELIEKYHLKKG